MKAVFPMVHIMLAAWVVVSAGVIGCAREEAKPALSVSTTPGSAITLTDSTFKATIAKGVVLVDFWATWCPPCRIQGPHVDQVAGLIGSLAVVGKVDVDANPVTAQAYKIESIPTLIVFKDGKEFKKFVGVTDPNVLLETLQAAIGKK